MFTDGGKCRREIYMDMFSDDDVNVEFTDEKGYGFYVKFNPQTSTYDYNKGGTIIAGADCEIDWQENYYDSPEDQPALEVRKQRKIDYIVIRRKGTKSLHYAV